jgi:long-chain acyl-CoA synthetase
VKEELREVLPEHVDMVIMYGATEASARLSYLEPHMLKDKIESIGWAIPNVTLKVLDPDGNELPAGEVGEITGFGANIMQGYWKDEEATKAVLDHNGYHTGDLGYMDNDGYFFIVGRKDNMLKVGGHRINTQEIEDVLMETGMVLETAVFGVPDKLLGNRLIAVAVPIDDKQTGKDILDKSSEKLPKFKVPGEITLVKTLPKNPSGKINKGKCKELVLSDSN